MARRKAKKEQKSLMVSAKERSSPVAPGKIEPGENLESIPVMDIRQGIKALFPNNKLINQLTGRSVEDGLQFDIDVPIDSNTTVKTLCMINIDDCEEQGLYISKLFTEFDRSVYSAVATLYEVGNEYVSATAVYKAMSGTAISEPPEKQIDQVIDSLNKLRFTNITLNCTDELRARNIPIKGNELLCACYSTYLLNASAMIVRTSNYKLEAIKIEKEPVLNKYAKLTRQILQVPIKMLGIYEVEEKDGKLVITDKAVANASYRIQLKNYLARRIRSAAHSDRSTYCEIVFRSYNDYDGQHHAGLYEVAGFPDGGSSKVVAKRLRDYVETVLRYWIAAGYIEEYHFVESKNDKRVIHKVCVTICPWKGDVWVNNADISKKTNNKQPEMFTPLFDCD